MSDEARGRAARDVVVFGTGSFPRTVMRYLERDTDHRVVAFTVDGAYRSEPVFEGRPVIPFEAIRNAHSPGDVAMFVAIGYRHVNRFRAEVFERCAGEGYELISYVSPHAIRGGECSIGRNCFVFEAAVLGDGCRLGDGVIVWSGAHVAHDGTIGDHCFLAPRVAIAGNVSVGAESFIGTNATVRDGVAIAPATVVGAGALIMRDTVEGGVYSVRGTDPVEGVHSRDLNSL